jgi:hypothetical protein
VDDAQAAAERRRQRQGRQLARPPLGPHRHRGDGVYHEQGLLDTRWVDVLVMDRLLV